MKKKKMVTESGTTSRLAAEVPLDIHGFNVMVTAADIRYELMLDDDGNKANTKAYELELTLTGSPKELEHLSQYVANMAMAYAIEEARK